MSAIENYPQEIREIEHEIAWRLVALHIDYKDDAALRQLAREAVKSQKATGPDGDSAIRRDLIGLATLMLKVMGEGATEGQALHGGPVWKAFGKALWEEYGATQGDRR